MPSKNVKQREALIAKKGITWVRAHGFDKIDPRGAKAGHKKKK
jgi:hypothetical protein